MLLGNMPSIVINSYSHVRTQLALVYNSNIHMGADMTIKTGSIGSAERAMGTHMGLTSFKYMPFQTGFG